MLFSEFCIVLSDPACFLGVSAGAINVGSAMEMRLVEDGRGLWKDQSVKGNCPLKQGRATI